MSTMSKWPDDLLDFVGGEGVAFSATTKVSASAGSGMPASGRSSASKASAGLGSNSRETLQPSMSWRGLIFKTASFITITGVAAESAEDASFTPLRHRWLRGQP